jgi:hypothetical protein
MRKVFFFIGAILAIVVILGVIIANRITSGRTQKFDKPLYLLPTSNGLKLIDLDEKKTFDLQVPDDYHLAITNGQSVGYTQSADGFTVAVVVEDKEKMWHIYMINLRTGEGMIIPDAEFPLLSDDGSLLAYVKNFAAEPQGTLAQLAVFDLKIKQNWLIPIQDTKSCYPDDFTASNEIIVSCWVGEEHVANIYKVKAGSSQTERLYSDNVWNKDGTLSEDNAFLAFVSEPAGDVGALKIMSMEDHRILRGLSGRSFVYGPKWNHSHNQLYVFSGLSSPTTGQVTYSLELVEVAQSYFDTADLFPTHKLAENIHDARWMNDHTVVYTTDDKVCTIDTANLTTSTPNCFSVQ